MFSWKNKGDIYLDFLSSCLLHALLCFLREKAFVCFEVLQPSQAIEVMSSAVSLPNHTFTGHA